MSNLNFTKAALDALPLPAAGTRATHHDAGGRESVAGLQVRVTANGVKTFSVFKRAAGGKPERVTIGRYPDVSIDQARKKAKAVISQLAQGESPAAAKRESKVKSMTLAAAVARYVEEQTRESDGLPLKARTRSDYLNMVKPSRPTAAGKRTKGGTLAALASRPIHDLTASAIKAVNDENRAQRGERQSAYAMVVLKAVLNFYGVTIAHSPFDRATPKAERVVIPKSRPSDEAPVVALLENLGALWRALQAVPDTPAADYLRFILLTGCRPSEPRAITMVNVDLAASRVTLRDTKTRTDHIIYLSHQALAIVERQAKGKAGTDRLFPVTEAEVRALVLELSATTGLAVSAKNMRKVFASVAELLVSAHTYRCLMNRGKKNSEDDKSYLRKTVPQMRAGWQRVADFIDP